jgi:hypothetical protein
MTRANLNFVWQTWGEKPKTWYFYWNGDQYPSGLRDCYGIREWLSDAKAFTPEGFTHWIAKNYHEQRTVCQPARISHPAIYLDTAGFPTDYSYVFTVGGLAERLPQTTAEKAQNTHKLRWLSSVTVYQWDKRIFQGTVARFLTWLNKRPKWH